jgi:deoxyribose-phosphate aldolase
MDNLNMKPRGLTSQTLTPSSLASMIDHTFLKAFGTAEDIERLCEEALRYDFAMVAVNPAEVTKCARLLAGSSVRVGAAIGFPLGQNTSEVKAFEIRDSIQKGAGEIDMVINVRALQSGDAALVRREIADMVKACLPVGVISKVILETCYLTDAEKASVCRLAVAEGADYVKTSTGVGPAGATVADVRLMRAAVGSDTGVKAAGGIRDLATALAMIEAGATRLGTSAGVAIVQELAASELRGEQHGR